MAVQWPSEIAGKAPRVPLLLRRKTIARDLIWGTSHASCVAGYEFLQSRKPVQRGGDRFELLTDVEAKRIRDLAKIESVFWLDPNQEAVVVELPSDSYSEYRVEAYHWGGIKERNASGEPTGYMVEQEKHVQILVGREIRKGKVVREWEHDFEEVPLTHFIDVGCFGSSDWRSKFAEHIR